MLGNDKGVSAAADLWSLGMLLFHAASGAPYWPRTYSQLDMVQCLLGHVSLPHEASPHMLDAAGALLPIVSRLLSRSPEARPSVLDVGEFAAHGVTEAVMGLTSQDVCFPPSARMLRGRAARQFALCWLRACCCCCCVS